MPPPSPVWAWKRGEEPAVKVYSNATLHMSVRIEGAWYHSKPAPLKVKGADNKFSDD